MKRYLAVFIILTLLLSLCSISHADEKEQPEVFTSGDWQYIILEDGTASIAKYLGEETEVTVPDILDGKKVTSIGKLTFAGSNLASITIPDGVTSVGEFAFAYCHSLRSIVFPDSLMHIGKNPFVSCNVLTNIIVSPDHMALAVKDGVLYSKADKRLVCYPYAVKGVVFEIPQGIRIIGDYAFYSCSSLTSIVIPDSVTSVGESAFIDCFSLTSIVIPDSVTSIGDDAFSFCKSLASIVIPDSVTSIGKSSFSSCDSLTSITIPNSVTSIGDYAFSFCRSLASITIPDSVTSIGDGVFSSCESLASITIPDSVMHIGSNPFHSCKALTSIIVSPEHTALAVMNGVLYSKADKRLVCYPYTATEEEFEIPQGIRIIGDSAFVFCDSLTSITIPDSVTTIEDFAFGSCDLLASITIPDSVTHIGDQAFRTCESLRSLTIPDSVTEIGKDAFSGCRALTITVSRGSYAAQYCKENELNYTYPDADDWLKD